MEPPVAAYPTCVPTLEWLVDGLLYRDTVAVIFGPSGTAKSLVAQDMGQCVATDFAWQGRAVHQGKVRYDVAEGTSGIRRRHEAWREHHVCGPSPLCGTHNPTLITLSYY